MTKRDEEVVLATSRYDNYMNYKHCYLFQHAYHQVYKTYTQTFSKKRNKMIVTCILDSDIKEIATAQTIGFFNGNELDERAEEFKLSMDKYEPQSRLDLCPGTIWESKVTFIRTDVPPTTVPALMTQKDLDATWLDGQWYQTLMTSMLP